MNKEMKNVKNRIILGIGILIILLALAGTGSAKSAYSAAGADCSYCHVSIVDGNYALTTHGSYFREVHKFNGISVPNIASSCLTCHPDLSSFLPLTSVGSSYNKTHRYNATTLASKMLPGPGCANCHVNVIGNDFSFITGTPTYLTSSVCQDCHKPKYDNWKNTTHAYMLTPANKAQAMGLRLPPQLSDWSSISYVLVTKFQFSYINTTGYWLAQNDTYNTETETFGQVEFNSSPAYTGTNGYTCASCHTTGYNASGNILPGIKGTFAETGIACERCHGPAGNGHQVTVNYSATLCTNCHSGSHHGTGWEQSAHAPPAIRNSASCMQCHSPFDRYLNLTQNISVPTLANATDVACGVCHNSHDITDSTYADTFSNGIFNQTKWSEPANAKLSFFNATASIAAGTDVFDDLATQVLIIPGTSSLLGPIDLTGKPVSEVLCSKCHYNHGLDHMKGVPLNHGRPGEQATCTDCHMSGYNVSVGRDMMAKHAMNAKTTTSCNCHKTAPSIMREWTASVHNDKQVTLSAAGGPNHFYGTLNTTTGVANAQPNSCLKCKDPMNFNPNIDQSNTTKINLTDSFKGITCAVCHNIHDMADWLNNTKAVYGVSKPYAWYNVTTKNYTMMDNTIQLCGNCHSNVRYGNTGPGWASATATNPISVHGFPAKDLFVGSEKEASPIFKFECTTCHFAKQTRNFTTGASLTADERIGGHSFQVNTTILMNTSKDCYTCHITGTKLGNLSTTIATVQSATHAKWNTTNATVINALNIVKAYNGEKNVSRTLIAQAYWNVRLVSSDESWGVHNPTKIIQLLDDAASLANQSIASLGSSITGVTITPTTPSAGSEMNITVAINNPGASFNGRVEGNVWLPDGSGKYLGWETVVIPSGASTVTITGAAGGNEASYIPHTSGAYLYDVFLENVDKGQVYTNSTDSKTGVPFTVRTAANVFISNVVLSSAPMNGNVMTLSVTISNPTASAFAGTMDANVWDSASGHVLTPQNINIAANGNTTLTFSYTPVKTGLHSYDFFMLSPGLNTKTPWNFPCMDYVAGIGFTVV